MEEQTLKELAIGLAGAPVKEFNLNDLTNDLTKVIPTL